MSLYKRKNSSHYWMQFTGPDGERIQQTAGTADLKQARELHDTLKANLWRQKRLKERPRRTWQEAVTQWLTEQASKRSLEEDKKSLRWLHPHLHGIYLDRIDRAMIEAIKRERAKDVTPETANRTLAVLRAILNRAEKEWEWLDRAPFVRLFPTEKKRLRWLTPEEAAGLLRELPPHLAEMARFALATGLRESNVTGLRWSQIDMARRCVWIHPDQSKNKRGIGIPLNDDALACVRRQTGKHHEHVFTYNGQPITRANNHAWRNALKRAGLENFRWHDLRHTWASWHIQSGTPLHVLKELGGWQDLSMVQRYAHLSPAHLAEYAGNSSNHGTKLLQPVKPKDLTA